MATLTDQLNKQTEQVNKMYDANNQAQLARLETAYNQNMSDRQASMAQINPAYQQKANDLSVQYERNRRNANIQAAGNGLNTGTASQMALAQGSAYQRDYGRLRTAQQNALDEAQRGIDDMKVAYQSEVNAAIAQNDYQRAAALLDQYKTNYQNQLTLAANLAKYGDFSGYNGIYDSSQIKTMQSNWIASNPDLAYRTGAIDANKYKKMTGKWPAGYTPPSTGGGSGYYGNPLKTGNDNPLADDVATEDEKKLADTLTNFLIKTGSAARTSATSAASNLQSALRGSQSGFTHKSGVF